MVDVVQLVRASDCGSECRGFESEYPNVKWMYCKQYIHFFYERYKQLRK